MGGGGAGWKAGANGGDGARAGGMGWGCGVREPAGGWWAGGFVTSAGGTTEVGRVVTGGQGVGGGGEAAGYTCRELGWPLGLRHLAQCRDSVVYGGAVVEFCGVGRAAGHS